jgi:hypothetical protein
MSVKMVKSFLATLFPITIPIIGVFGAINIYKHYQKNKKAKVRLQHINQYENQGYVISDSSQIINRYNSIPINTPYNYTNKEIVRLYMEELERKLGPDIRLARKNFSTLKVEKSKEIIKTGAVGIYEGSNNIIKYVKNNVEILGHEMLHMASYMYNPVTNTHHHGFMQQKDQTIIGVGLNEGYTELLTSRLFTNGKITSYPRLVRIVKLLEEFFPNPQLISHYYFTCNLPEFLQNLRRYCTQAEIKELLYGLDKLYELNSLPSSPIAIKLETQLATKLYNIYARSFVAEPAKVEAFRKKAGENKLTALALSGKKTNITRTSPFTRIKTSFQNGFRKIKNFFIGTQPTPQPAYSR